MEYDVSELLTMTVSYIDGIVGGNEFAAGAVIAGLMGTITYSLRQLPQSAFNLLIKHTTTSLELNSTNDSYHYFAKYLQDEGFANKSRFIKVGNGRWGRDENIKQIGYGTQVFWINWHTPVLITSYKEDSTSSEVKEFLTLKKIGRDHKFFNNMLTHIDTKSQDENSTKFYRFTDGYQSLITAQPKRRMETVALTNDTLRQLYNAIDSFVSKEQWYIKHQIPYQLGILLYGPPGTGKTSLIKAIAAYMKQDICYVDSDVALTGAAQIVNDAIIVAEEADTLCMESRSTGTQSELPDNNVPIAAGQTVAPPRKPTSEIDMLMDSFDKKILGKILNALDGIISNHGRVIILTTNHVDVLDPALLRPGRIDLQLEIGYVCEETFNQFLSRFFPDHAYVKCTVKSGVSPAVIQNDIILGFSRDELITKYTGER